MENSEWLKINRKAVVRLRRRTDLTVQYMANPEPLHAPQCDKEKGTFVERLLLLFLFSFFSSRVWNKSVFFHPHYK